MRLPVIDAKFYIMTPRGIYNSILPSNIDKRNCSEET